MIARCREGLAPLLTAHCMAFNAPFSAWGLSSGAAWARLVKRTGDGLPAAKAGLFTTTRVAVVSRSRRKNVNIWRMSSGMSHLLLFLLTPSHTRQAAVR